VTIRNRLTWLFVGVVGVLLLLVMSVIFILQKGYGEREYRQRLLDRAQVTGYIYLEKDEMRASAFRDFEKKYLQSLHNEILQVYDHKLEVSFVKEDERVSLSPALLARIISEKELFFSLGVRQAVGVFYHDNQGDFVIVVAAENIYGRQRLMHLASIMGGIFVASLLLIYLVGRVFAGRALQPIAALNDQVDRITAQDLHLRVDEGNLRVGDRDDLTRLAKTFNRLLGRLEESFEGQRTFVSNASHELRTPLTSVMGELQVLLNRERTPADYRESVHSALAELQELKLLINSLLMMAQAESGVERNEEVRLDELLWEVREGVPVAARSRLAIDLGELPDDPAELEIKGHRALLVRALGNIIDNALKYSGPEQPVTVRLRRTASDYCISVQDVGQGIAAEDLPKVFQPFYRSAQVRGVGGHGVGLPLARRIVELHGGQLSLTSSPGQGTLVEVVLARQ